MDTATEICLQASLTRIFVAVSRRPNCFVSIIERIPENYKWIGVEKFIVDLWFFVVYYVHDKFFR